jgi:hypothetical protein
MLLVLQLMQKVEEKDCLLVAEVFDKLDPTGSGVISDAKLEESITGAPEVRSDLAPNASAMSGVSNVLRYTANLSVAYHVPMRASIIALAFIFLSLIFCLLFPVICRICCCGRVKFRRAIFAIATRGDPVQARHRWPAAHRGKERASASRLHRLTRHPSSKRPWCSSFLTTMPCE